MIDLKPSYILNNNTGNTIIIVIISIAVLLILTGVSIWGLSLNNGTLNEQKEMSQ